MTVWETGVSWKLTSRVLIVGKLRKGLFFQRNGAHYKNKVSCKNKGTVKTHSVLDLLYLLMTGFYLFIFFDNLNPTQCSGCECEGNTGIVIKLKL